ncbi:hypothetical protein [Spirulina major]|uniref:hypothetical protein n=1 Tax=Spirulina major TaxID=270636 RepID=UPI0009333A59|nr:hypothetical protein [Spirulina major]
MLIRRLCLALLPASLSLGLHGLPSAALPGQPTEIVAAWILGNGALQGSIGDGLSVRRSNGGSQTFEFAASIFPPGRRSGVASRGSCATPTRRGRIRSEAFVLRDFVNGVPVERLELGLRMIYGLDVYQDYHQGALIYAYPRAEVIDTARRLGLPGVEGNYGEVRLGDRYAFWLDMAQTETGINYSGQVTVFLKEDLPKLVRELGGEVSDEVVRCDR